MVSPMSFSTCCPKSKGLRVVARTSSFAFKGKSDDIATIGQKLNVATLLEGSVRKSGNRARISAQLVKVADSAHVWSETYDRTLDDIFAVQDEIAQAVVWELQRTLMADAPGALFAKSSMTATASAALSHEIANAAKGRTSNAEAHRLLMQARFLISRAGEADLQLGVDYARQALAPDDADALASAAMLCHVLGQNEKSLAYAWRSIDLDPLNQRNWREVAQTLTAMGSHAEAETTLPRWAGTPKQKRRFISSWSSLPIRSTWVGGSP